MLNHIKTQLACPPCRGDGKSHSPSSCPETQLLPRGVEAGQFQRAPVLFVRDVFLDQEVEGS